MTLTVIPERHGVSPCDLWSHAPRPSARPATVIRRGPVVALRQRHAVALGTLAEWTITTGDRLVTAHDASERPWWIPADAVWSDAGSSGHPEHPRPIGLATAPTRPRSMLAGLSDRLGWEAVLEFERGRHLRPVAALAAVSADDRVVVLDGRLGHDVPTVVVLGRAMVRWGAGATWSAAMRRAMYGDDGRPDAAAELSAVCDMLAEDGLGVVAVDLGSPLLRRAGITRSSVQIVTA